MANTERITIHGTKCMYSRLLVRCTQGDRVESVSRYGWPAGETIADGKGKHCERNIYIMFGDHKEKPLQTKADLGRARLQLAASSRQRPFDPRDRPRLILRPRWRSWPSPLELMPSKRPESRECLVLARHKAACAIFDHR